MSGNESKLGCRPSARVRPVQLQGGVFILSSFFRFCFPLLASWLLGFLASWLFGFLASWLFGFPLLGFSGFLLVYAAFGGFWWLFGFGLSHPLHSQFLFGRWHFGFCVYAAFGGFWRLWLFASSAFTVPLWAFWFCTLSLVFGFVFPHHQHHQLRPI